MIADSNRLPTAALAALLSLGCKEKQHHGRLPTDSAKPERAAEAAPPMQPQSGAEPAAAEALNTKGNRPECPQFRPRQQIGKVRAAGLTEASGLAASRRTPGVLWAHNDSDGRARLFAMTRTGKDLGSYALAGTKALDCEDIAVGPGSEPGRWYLYLGDTGGNNQPRQQVIVYRAREPKTKLEQKPKKRKIKRKRITKLRLKYPKGVAPDAETLMVDPDTSDLYLATKTVAAESQVYRAKAPLDADRVARLEQVATLRFGEDGAARSALLTGGDIAADGSAIILRTYSDAYLWLRRDESIAQALSREPCRIPLSVEPHGEAIAFTAEGDGYITVSEGSRPPLSFYRRAR